jgi:type II restriction enzyme
MRDDCPIRFDSDRSSPKVEGLGKSMNLQGRSELARHLRSNSQVARVVTEDWCRRELYCLACYSESFQATPTGSPACDFVCPSCKENYELKSCRHGFGRRIADSGYQAMMAAIRDERTPSLIALQYSSTFQVISLFVVPRYFITEGVIEKRPPLGPTARRAGWVGCNILLHRIPEHGRIAIVSKGVVCPRSDVRDRFRRAAVSRTGEFARARLDCRRSDDVKPASKQRIRSGRSLPF